MPIRPIHPQLSRHTGQIPFLSRIGSSRYLSLHAARNGLPSLTLRPISGLRIPHMSFTYHRQILQRTMSNFQCRCYTSDESAPMTDPSRPDLFYHVLSPPTPISRSLPAFGLSFISKPPPSVDSSAIIGWLPAVSKGEEQEAGLNDFKENRESNTILYISIPLSHITL